MIFFKVGQFFFKKVKPCLINRSISIEFTFLAVYSLSRNWVMTKGRNNHFATFKLAGVRWWLIIEQEKVIPMSILFHDAIIFKPSVLGNIYVEEMKNSEIYVETSESIQSSSISLRVHHTDIRYPRMKADQKHRRTKWSRQYISP